MKKVLSLFLMLSMSVTMWGATSSVPENAPDVMLQAFYWDSYPSNSSNLGYGNTGWSTLINQADEIGEYFDLVWLPPCSQSSGGTGYIPKQYSNLNSDWGSESQLRELISKLKGKDTRAVADIVINHVTGNYGWCSFATMDFGKYGTFNPDASWICNTDEMNYDSGAGSCKGSAKGAADDGYGDEANYGAARDWDHKNSQVQAMFRAYLKWLKNDVGFDGWRYDYGKGFHHSHINDYNSAAGAYMSVVEYWDGNSGVIRSRLGEASWNNMAFDFGTKYDALNNGICSFDYAKCKGAGLLGAGLSKHAVTFVDNHDTFQRNSSEFGGQGNSMLSNMKDRLLQANAYILSMPGIPCVFYPHWVTYKSEIKKMIEARHLVGVHSQSEVKDEYAEQNGYQATIVGTKGYLILQLGNKVGGNFGGFTKYASGNGYAVWISSSAVPADPNAPKFYITGNDALVGDKEWKADAIAVKDNSYTFENLATGKDYKLKITTDGTWDTAKGYDDLTYKADGLSADDDGNICFSLSEAGDVKVKYTGSVFTLEGKFYVKQNDPIDPSETVTVYFVNNLNWTKVNAFVWPEEGDALKAWPGEAAKKEADKVNGNEVYSYKFPKAYINIIFNDGTTQTVDLTWDETKPYFYPTGKEGEKVKGTWYAKDDVPAAQEPEDPELPVDSATVFFVNALSWTKVNAFVWPEEGDALKAWPGEAAKKEADKVNGNEVYSYKFPKAYINIIFNDGTTQTVDLTWDETKPYFYPTGKEGEKVKGTWYAKDDVPAAQDPEDPELPVDSVTVFFVNALSWTKVNAFVWPATGDAYKTWPGEAAKKEADKVNGNEVYSYKFPKAYINIIFNDGTTQTVDLTWDETKPYFYPTGKEGEKVKGTWYAKDDVPAAQEPEDPEQPVDSVTVFFVNTLSWTKVNAFVWPEEGDALKAWPGEAAKKEADKVNRNEVYSYKFPKTYINIIFNDGTTQTVDLTWDETKPYFYPTGKEGEKVKGTWYAKDDVPAAQEPEDPEQPVDSVTVFFVNTLSWTKVNAFVWPEEGDALKAWPGEAAKKEADKVNGNEVYSYKFPKTYVNVIFNDGTTQTVDLTWDETKPYFYPTGKEGEKVKGTWYAKDDVPAAQEPEDPELPVDSVTVFFVNALSWTKVNAFVWPATGDAYKTWPGEAAKKEADKVNGNEVYSYKFPKTYINIIFNDGTTQTVDLTWAEAKPYFYPTGKEGEKVKGTWYAKDDVPAAQEPEDPELPVAAKFYITGNDALVGESKTWNADAIAVTEDSYTFENLAAGKDYKMKITIDGTWSTDKGYNNLTGNTDGLSTDASGNICFSLSETGNVTVTYTSTAFTVEGNFFLEPAEPELPEQTETLQLVPGVWEADGAKIAAWTWSKDLDGKWTEFFEPKDDKNDTLKAEIRAKADSILFVRFKADATKPTWSGGDGYIWNRIENDTIDHVGLIYTITDWSKGQWTVVTPTPDDPGQGDEHPEVTETLQLVPGVWTTDGAKIAAWTWGNDLAGKWTAFFEPKANDNDTLKADIRAAADSILFVRFNAEVIAPTWDKESSNVWNKLANDTIDHVGLIYTITGWNNGQWTVFTTTPDDPEQQEETVTVYFVNTVNWEAVNAYVWSEEGGAYKPWPGEITTTVAAPSGVARRNAGTLQGYDIFSYTFPSKYANIIFNNGAEQTVDLQWNADKPYFVPSEKDSEGKYEGTWYTKEEIDGDTGTDIDVIKAGTQATKVFRDGQLFIIRGTQTYTVMGQTVR